MVFGSSESARLPKTEWRGIREFSKRRTAERLQKAGRNVVIAFQREDWLQTLRSRRYGNGLRSKGI